MFLRMTLCFPLTLTLTDRFAPIVRAPHAAVAARDHSPPRAECVALTKFAPDTGRGCWFVVRCRS
jgi:hypothetical protein